MRHLDPDEILRGLHGASDASRERIHHHVAACAECRRLLAEAVSSAGSPSDPDDATRAGWPTVPFERYELAEEVGRGGLGRVIRARHVPLARTVAIKELLRADPMQERRFIREAEITAALQHPGVVPVLEAGRWPSGEPFYATQLVGGATLQARLTAARSLDDRLAILPHLIAVSETLAYAHARGVVHRDVKPSNILVGEFGETVVIDWGLAHVAGARDPDRGGAAAAVDDRLTRDGDVLGTPRYMAPEQARGEPVDPRADVYALGVILYELLAGGPPPDASTQRAGGGHRARPPAGAPRDLVEIAARAMAAEPDARYRDAGALADDLRRFSTGQLVSARSYTAGQRVVRWLRRHWLLNSVAAAAIAALAIVIGVAALRVTRARRVAEASVAQLELDQGRAAYLAGDHLRALAYLGAALRDGAEPAQTRYLLARAGAPLHHRAHVLTAAAPARLISAAVSRDAAQVVTGDDRGTLTWWDARAGRPVRAVATALGMIQGIAISPRGEVVFAKGTGTGIWDTATGAQLATIPDPASGMGGLELAADGATLLAWDGGELRVWDVARGRVRRTIAAHASPIVDAVVARDGAFAATFAWGDPVARVWDTTTGAVRCEIGGTGRSIATLAGSPDDAFLAVASDDGWLAIVDPRTCAERQRLATRAGELFGVRVDPQGTRVVVAGRAGAELWDVARGAMIATVDVPGTVRDVEFAPDGERFAAADDAAAVHIVSARDGRRHATLIGDPGSHIRELRWSRDGAVVLANALGGEVRLWDGQARHAVSRVGDAALERLGELADGSLAGIDHGGDAWRSDANGRWTRAARGVCPGLAARIPVKPRCEIAAGLALRVGGRRAVLARLDGDPPPAAPAMAATTGALAPGGRRAALATPAGEIVVWQTSDGAAVGAFTATGATTSLPRGPVLALAFLDDDRVVVMTRAAIEVRAATTGARLVRIERATPPTSELLAASGARGVIFAPAGDHEAVLFDADTGARIASLQGQRGRLLRAELGRDGELLVTQGADRGIAVWDTRTGSLLDRIAAGDDVAFQLADGGATLVTVDAAGELQRWDLRRDVRPAAAIEHDIAACVPYQVTQGRLAPRAATGGCRAGSGGA